MPKKRILIIDDEENFCRLVKKNLELMGNYEVAVATSGKQGLVIAKEGKPQLILLDILMAGMDGFEVLKRLKGDLITMEIPVVMLSAKSDMMSKIKAAQLYDEEYITKPIEASALKIKIDEVLERRGIK